MPPMRGASRSGTTTSTTPKGFFYFLAHDARVPKALQDETNHWGLAKDEFLDTENWPHQLYIREARRMVSDFVMTQKDVQTELTKPDAIGMGSYNSDSHNVQRIVTPEGNVENEGDMQVAVKPYQIPYRVIVPKRTEATNLLVPVCFSASHVAYSSLRMEPQYMIIGEAAGLAASISIGRNEAVQDIDTQQLTETLKKQGAVMGYRGPAPVPPTISELFHKQIAGAPARRGLSADRSHPRDRSQLRRDHHWRPSPVVRAVTLPFLFRNHKTAWLGRLRGAAPIIGAQALSRRTSRSSRARDRRRRFL